MNDVLLTAVLSGGFGLGGVAVGGFLRTSESRAAERRKALTEARTAARLAGHKLLLWERAGDVLTEARAKPQSIINVVLYTHVLRRVREHLDLNWWEANVEALAAVASPEEWRDLSDAAHAAQGCLTLLDGLLTHASGEPDERPETGAEKDPPSEDAVASRTDATEREVTSQAELHPVPTSGPGAPGHEEDPHAEFELEFDPETEQLLKEFESLSAEQDAKLSEMNTQLDRLRADVDSWREAEKMERLDSVAKTIIGARGRFRTAQRVCCGFAQDPGGRRERREAGRRRALADAAPTRGRGLLLPGP
jgi:hypothetical protein